MNQSIAKLFQKKAVGIYLGEHTVDICRIVTTALGTRLIDRASLPTNGPRTKALIAELTSKVIDTPGWKEAPVVVGLSVLDVFYSSRLLKSAQCDATPQVILHEMLKSSTLNIDDMEVDMLRHQTPKNATASIVACQKRVLQPVLQALDEKGIRPHQIEPAVCGLLRWAIRLHKSPRRATKVLRCFLGEQTAVAVLTNADFPMLWRPIALPAGNEDRTLYSLYRCIEKIGASTGLDAVPDQIMFHGRPDLSQLGTKEIWGELSARIQHHADPGYSPDALAYGTALGAHYQGDSFNLARAMKPPINLLRHVPWGQVVIQSAIMASAAFFLMGNLSSLESTAKSIEDERASIPWLKDTTIAKLQEEKRSLTERLEVIRGFVGGRILWSVGLREVAEGLPNEMVLTSLEGRCEYRPDPKGKENPRQSKRSLIAAIDAPIPKGEAIPREIDGLLGKLRSNPKLREDLPTIELGTLRWTGSANTKTPTASFTVVCLPKSMTPLAKPAGGPQ